MIRVSKARTSKFWTGDRTFVRPLLILQLARCGTTIKMGRRLLLALTMLFAMTFMSTAQIFPNPTSQCEICANAGGTGAACAQASAGLPGKYCYPWINSGVKKACCCPTAAICPTPKTTPTGCSCDTPVAAPVVVKKKTPVWVWIVVAIAVILLAIAIWWFCCNTTTVVEEPVIVEQPVYVHQPGVVYQQQPGVVYQQPVVYQQGYTGGEVAAGVAAGAAVGMIGGVALGVALADHGDGGHYVVEGGYGGGGYDNGGGGDFAGDF
ncbi:unnamed protein product [Aphanomyces euteiches]